MTRATPVPLSSYVVASATLVHHRDRGLRVCSPCTVGRLQEVAIICVSADTRRRFFSDFAQVVPSLESVTSTLSFVARASFRSARPPALFRRAHSVALVTGDGFGYPKGIRISYAASMEDIDEALGEVRAKESYVCVWVFWIIDRASRQNNADASVRARPKIRNGRRAMT